MLSCGFFCQILSGEQYKPVQAGTMGPVCLLVCGRMSSLSFFERTIDWGGENGFGWRG